MKQIANWDKVQGTVEREVLPKGGYVLKILDAQVVRYVGKDGGAFEKLELSYDIAEGAFRDFYTREYQGQNGEEKRWKGKYALYIPTEDGSERDGWTQRKLKAALGVVEESNPGYHWDWNEGSLKGKYMGGLFRREEWSFSGKHGWSTRCYSLYPVEKVRAGAFTLWEDKPLAGAPQAPGAGSYLEDTADLPF